MPAALPLIFTRMQDLDDAPVLGPADSGQALVWNDTTKLFETASIGGGGVTIDDGSTSASTVWSSSKTDAEIGIVDTALTTHTGDATLHRIINDAGTSLTELWSASKIDSEITTVSGNLTTHTSDLTIHRAINDVGSSATELLSSSQVDTRIGLVNSNLSAHTGNASLHRIINDAGTSATELWSASKIDTDIGAVNTSLTTHTGDATLHRIINDAGTSATELWSASKINTDITAVGTSLTTHTSDATIHRVINDAGAGVTDLLSADEIDTRIAAGPGGGGGDFFADGSVPMTGSLNLAGTATISTDADTLHLFGRAAVGAAGFSDSAFFGHRDHFNTTGYGFRQASFGAVFINCPTSQSISFNINNSNIVNFSAASANFNSLPIQSNDADVAYTLGRSSIGYDGTSTDRAIYAHRDHATSTGAAFAQEADGDAIINAPTGQTIQFKSNGADTVRINSAGRLGVGTTSVDALLHVEDGSAGVVPVALDAVALFEHSGAMSMQMIAPVNTVFAIRADTPTGANTNLALEYRSQFATLGVNLGITFGYDLGQSSINPRVDNIASLGTSGSRFTEVWALDGTINTSDEDDKTSIRNSRLGLDFVNKLTPKEWKWKESKSLVDGEVVLKKRKERRKHYGLVAQDVKTVLDDLKIDTQNFAGYIVGEDGKHGLRYHQFIAPMIKAIQELSAKVEALENA